MNHDRTNDKAETETDRRVAENQQPAPMIPSKREGDVRDGAGQPLHERDDRSPIEDVMSG